MLASRRVLPWFGAALLALSAFAGFGCDKKSAPAAEPPSGMPPLVADTAKAPANAVHSLHDPVDPNAALPAGHPKIEDDGRIEGATPGNINFDPKTVLKGEIRLSSKLKNKVNAGDVIYIIARSADQPGPPLAVRRLTSSTWPLAFSLDSRDAMMAGTQLAGKVTVSVRVDKDGDAMTKNPGDIVGSSAPLTPPDDKVVINLDKTL